jgi:DNA-binding CsgD family transcriptional regulator
MRIGLDEDLANSLDIAAPSGRRVVVTIRLNSLPHELAQLTDGQRDCLRLVYQHMKSKDIARTLGVSPHTVDMRLRTAMKTLSVGSRIEAARLLVQLEAGGAGADAYQPLIYHTPDVVSSAVSATFRLPASSQPGDPAHQGHQLRFSPDVDPNGSGPPRDTLASVAFGSAHLSSGTGADVTNPDIGSRPLVEALPRGKKNTLGVGARIGWIFGIAVCSAMAFGAVMAALASLKTLL